MFKEKNKNQIDNLIKLALNEDVGLGDITTRSIISEKDIFQAEILAKNDLVLCGLDIFKAVFFYLDTNVSYCDDIFKDGDFIKSGTIFLKMKGRGVALLEGERVALNIIQRLCGIASLTKQYVDRAKPIKILDTRKTTPGFRIFEKYAVLCGGGVNHRFGLFDAILIKDNHIKASGGITQAIEAVRKSNKGLMQIEVEASTLEEVKDAIAAKSDIIMLDNMTIEDTKKAVEIIGEKAKIEVSGSISLEKLDTLSKLDINFISIGSLTHSPKASDISMNFILP
jgi:nicotinate-nucleotide pyrophosphorylase (carboxylating)|tara:strand:- start:207 stop:1052 length:846 start_codon:yes stop_codon:yes gene_type:complete